MSEEPRPEPLGPEHPLLHHQAGVISSMLDAMCKEDKDMVLSYLGLTEVEDVLSRAESDGPRKMGDTAKKKQ